MRVRYFLGYILFLSVAFSLYFTGCSKERNPFAPQTSTCTASECHGATSLRQYPPSTGQHAIHLVRGYICENCHYNYLDKSIHKDGVLDVNGNEDIVFFDSLNPSGVWNNSTSDCSYIACHGGGSTPVNWYAEVTGDCTVCHSEGSPIDPLTTNGEGVKGKHIAHVQNQNIDCNSCHYDYKSKSTHMNNTYGGSNENGSIVGFGGTFDSITVTTDFNDDTGECSNISCHGGTGGVNWYSDSSGCTSCHSSGSAIDPMTTNGSGTDGKHSAHVADKAIECVICHEGYKDRNTHMNGTYGKAETDTIVYFGGSWPDGGTAVTSAFDDSTGLCSSVSCHGGIGSIDWYGSIPACTDSCHSSGSKVGSTFIDATSGSHSKHLSVTGIICTDCHTGYNSRNTHLDGTVDTFSSTPEMISFDSSRNPSGVYGSNQCSGLYCHGNFTGGNGNSSPPTWGGAVDCSTNQCHGNDLSGNPADSGNPDSKHATHLSMIMNITNPGTGQPYTKSEACTVCHDGHGYSTATHVNWQVDIAFNYNNPEGAMGTVASGGTFNSGTGEFNHITCSSTYCHGNFTGGNTDSVSWTEAVSDSGWCGSCHTTAPSTVKHSEHLAVYSGQCGYCHQGYTSTSAPSGHVSLKKDVVFGYPHPLNTGGNPSYDNTTKVCTNVYCHGNFPRITYDGVSGVNPGNGDNPTWDDLSTAACGSCHGSATDNYSSVTHGKHTTTNENPPYFNDPNRIESCDACHAYGDDTDTGFTSTSTQGSYGTSNHADFSISDSGVNADVSFKAADVNIASKTGANGNRTTWNSSTTSCRDSWCHGNFDNGSGIVGYNATPDWLNPSSLPDCTTGACHEDSSTMHGYWPSTMEWCIRCHPGADDHPYHVDGTIIGVP